MAELRCAVAMLPAGGGDTDRMLRSLKEAKAFGLGDFSEIVPLPVSAGSSSHDVLQMAATKAAAERFDWLLAVTSAETLVADIFVKSAPALRLHDVVWGGAGLGSNQAAATRQHPTPNPSPQGGGEIRVERITRLAAQDLPGFFHAALAWWIGPSHFVRPAQALRALQTDDTAGWYADYMLSLWKSCSAYKTAQALTLFHGAVPPVSVSDRTRLVDHLRREPVFMDVRFGAATLRLPYTGLNPVIEREQMRGLFFEQEELQFLAQHLPRGLRIADVGANTGNHTLFFATVMQAATVIPIEPHPRSVQALKAVIAENGLNNVDQSAFGVAAGASEGRLRIAESVTAGLGAAHMVQDAGGSVRAAPLDAIFAGPVDLLKIDVEGMEMEVLKGAEKLIARDRPILFIEVVDTAIGAFMAWLDEHNYRIEKLFPDKTHCNYFAVPAETQPGRARR